MPELKTLTLKSLLDESTEKFAEHPAVANIDDEAITYGEFRKKVLETIQLLRERGITPGDRVALLSENKPNWGIAYFAVTTMGAVVVPILPDFHAGEIQHIIRHAGCKAIFVSRRLYEKIEEADFESVSAIIFVDDWQPVSAGGAKETLKEVAKKGGKELGKIKKAALKLAGKLPAEVREDDLASIIYTSGTTGHSKGVMLTHKNLVFDALQGSKIQTVTPEDRFLSILPLSHTYECTIGFLIPLMRGACVYYFDKTPSPRLLLQALEKIKPTIMLCVPLVIEKIYKTRVLPQLTGNRILRGLVRIPVLRKPLHRAAGKKLQKAFGGHLRFFGIGGALLSPEVEKFLREAKFPYAIGYGLTETAPLVAGSSFENSKFRSTGPAITGVEIKITDPNPETGEGEIWVRGENVMKGYFKDPERTKEVITEDGWFKTGDLGVLDKDNYLYIKGRLKNMIVGPSGENIYPEEIESVLGEFDCVMESLVFMQEGKITARIHLNYEEIDKKFATNDLTETQMRKKVAEVLEYLRQEANKKLSSFSRIQKVIEQTEPFEKTPTQKTKRYLYVE